MNEKDLIKEYDEKAKALRDAFISKLKDDKKEFELTYPEDNEILYCVNNDIADIVEIDYNAYNMDDKFLYEHGYYFNTEQEVVQHLKERRLLFKLQQWAEKQNDGWKPDWEEDEKKKWYVYYNHVEESLKVTWGYNSTNFIKLPYFKSEEIGKECIDLFGDEIKEVLC